MNTSNSEYETSYSDIRKGFSALVNVETKLLNMEGVELLACMQEALIDESPDRFYNILKENIGSGGDLPVKNGARLVADAQYVSELPNKTPIYIDILTVSALSHAKIANTDYLLMGETERRHLVNFLYRPARKRPFPDLQKWNMLYPGLDKLPREMIDSALEVDMLGVTFLLSCLVESGTEYPPNDEILKLWVENKWEKYIISSGINWEKVEPEIPFYNSPEAIENILQDIINMQEDSSYNLDNKLKVAKIVIPIRDKLDYYGYFANETKEFDRQEMIRTIIGDRHLG